MVFRLTLIFSLFLISCRTIKTDYGKERSYYKTTVIDKGENVSSEQKQVAEKVKEPIEHEAFEKEVVNKTDHPEVGTPVKLSKSSEKETLNEVPENSVNTDDPTDEEKLEQAYWAERQSMGSLILGWMSTISSVFIPPLAVLLLIPTLIFYSRGNQSRFNTKKGERHLSSARILMLLSLIFLVIWTIIILALIML